MVDRSVFDLRLERLERLLRSLRSLASVERASFLVDEALQAQAERWMHLAAECSIDLANHLIADRAWKSPSTNRETFQVLADNGVLEPDLARQMEGWAGLRNILVHLYLEIDYEKLFEILTKDLPEIEAFVAAMTRFVFELGD